MTTHTCCAEGCEREIPSWSLMCRRHWRMVPRELRQRVVRLYRPGMAQGALYRAAAREAIEVVAHAEAKAAAR